MSMWVWPHKNIILTLSVHFFEKNLPPSIIIIPDDYVVLGKKSRDPIFNRMWSLPQVPGKSFDLQRLWSLSQVPGCIKSNAIPAASPTQNRTLFELQTCVYRLLPMIREQPQFVVTVSSPRGRRFTRIRNSNKVLVSNRRRPNTTKYQRQQSP